MSAERASLRVFNDPITGAVNRIAFDPLGFEDHRLETIAQYAMRSGRRMIITERTPRLAASFTPEGLRHKLLSSDPDKKAELIEDMRNGEDIFIEEIPKEPNVSRIRIKNPSSGELLRIVKNQSGKPNRRIVCLVETDQDGALHMSIDSNKDKQIANIISELEERKPESKSVSSVTVYTKR